MLVMPAKQHQDPRPRFPMDLTNYQKSLSECSSNLVAQSNNAFFRQTNYGAYSNPGTQWGPEQGFQYWLTEGLN